MPATFTAPRLKLFNTSFYEFLSYTTWVTSLYTSNLLFSGLVLLNI